MSRVSRAFRSLRSRLVLSYLLVVLLAMGIAAGLALGALDRAFLDVLRENLLAEAERVAEAIEAQQAGQIAASDIVSSTTGETSTIFPLPYTQSLNVTPGYHRGFIHMVILEEEVSDALPGRIVSVDPSFAYREVDARTAASQVAALETPPEEEDSVPLQERPEVQRALAGTPATEIRAYDWSPQRRVLYAAYPVRAPDGDISGVVYIASPIPRFNLSLLPATFGPQAVGGVLLAITLAGLAGLLLARTLTRPLRRLTDAASTLARGEHPPPLPPAPTEELQRLGTAFNTMNAHLDAAHEALAAQARQREAILHSLADAVLAVDAAGEIILANPAGSDLLALAPQSLRETVARTLDLGEPQSAEIGAQGRVLELLATPLRDENGASRGAVAVAHDVTAYRQLDRLRTNFVSDVSHELRTPLTAIKGFVETLQDGASDDPAARDRFLCTIATETERLTRLTDDLLLLTRADAGRLELQRAPTDLRACVDRAAAQLESRAREKGIGITIEPVDEPLCALADADRVHQVLVNLLDNAIKFTPAEGRVILSFGQEGNQATCTVADSGPGIPEEELAHIFERFYRGDPSRTRGRGENGSGLGLAIARAIVEAHGGRLWAESAPGRGASFTFTLPADPHPESIPSPPAGAVREPPPRETLPVSPPRAGEGLGERSPEGKRPSRRGRGRPETHPD